MINSKLDEHSHGDEGLHQYKNDETFIKTTFIHSMLFWTTTQKLVFPFLLEHFFVSLEDSVVLTILLWWPETLSVRRQKITIIYLLSLYNSWFHNFYRSKTVSFFIHWIVLIFNVKNTSRLFIIQHGNRYLIICTFFYLHFISSK